MLRSLRAGKGRFGAAVLTAAVASVLGPQAKANLTIDLKIDDGSGYGGATTATVTAGQVVYINVYGTVSGTDGLSTNEKLQTFGGNILSSAIGSNLAGTLGVAGATFPNISAPPGYSGTGVGVGLNVFTRAGSRVPTLMDRDSGSGNFDLVGFVARAAEAVEYDTSGASGVRDGNSSRWLIGRISFTVAPSISIGSTKIAYDLPLSGLISQDVTPTNAVVWQEEGGQKDPSNGGSVVSGSYITLNSPAATTYTLTMANTGTVHVLKGGTLAGANSSIITNTGVTGTNDTLNYTNLSASSGATGIATVSGNNASGGPLATGGGTASASLTVTGVAYGTATVTSTVGTATNATVGGNATQSGSSGTFNVNVGQATVGSVAGLNKTQVYASGVFGDALAGSGTVLSSKTTAGGDAIGSEAIIYKANDASVVQMKWRARTSVADATPASTEVNMLYTDVVWVTGMGSFTLQPEDVAAHPEAVKETLGSYYTMVMPFTPDVAPSRDHPYWLSFLNLGADNAPGGTGTNADYWIPAGDMGEMYPDGTHPARMDSTGDLSVILSNPSAYDGKTGYAYDSANSQWVAWARVNYDNVQFAVVPLPPSYLAGLVGLGGLAVMQIRRRRRA